MAKRTRYNNRKIIRSEQTLSLSKILAGMFVTFNYSESGVTDPSPLLLFLHHDMEKNILEGLNLNYVNPAKITKLFQVIEFKKGKKQMENLVYLKEDYFRVQISVSKKRSFMTPQRFYNDVIKADNVFLKSYRSYKTDKLSALKVTTISPEISGMEIKKEGIFQDAAGRWRDNITNRYVKAPK